MQYYYLDCIKHSCFKAFINAWCFLPMLIPKLNIDIRNWSQDMKVLKGGNLESKDPPLIKIEINGGPPILIHVFTLTCLLTPVMFRAHR